MHGDAKQPAVHQPATTLRRLLVLVLVTPLCLFLACAAFALWVAWMEPSISVWNWPEALARGFEVEARRFQGYHSGDPWRRSGKWNRPPRFRHSPSTQATEADRAIAEWQQRSDEEWQQKRQEGDAWAEDIIKQLQAANP